MATRRMGAFLALAVALIGTSPAFAEGEGRVEGFAGYYFGEELAEDVSYGARGAWRPSPGWGLMASFESFSLSGDDGYGESNVDADIAHFEVSFLAYPTGKSFEMFCGLGYADVSVDTHVPGAAVDLDKGSLSLHVGLGYRAALGDTFYLRPEVRARSYDVVDSTIDVTASIALGFSWAND